MFSIKWGCRGSPRSPAFFHVPAEGSPLFLSPFKLQRMQQQLPYLLIIIYYCQLCVVSQNNGPPQRNRSSLNCRRSPRLTLNGTRRQAVHMRLQLPGKYHSLRNNNSKTSTRSKTSWLIDSVYWQHHSGSRLPTAYLPFDDAR